MEVFLKLFNLNLRKIEFNLQSLNMLKSRIYSLRIITTLITAERKEMDFKIECSCGKTFTYNIYDINRIKKDYEGPGIVPLILPHDDHFVTVYIDNDGNIRSVEQLLIAKNRHSSRIIEEMPYDQIKTIVDSIRKSNDPIKNYYKFISVLLTYIHSPAALFSAGEYTGYNTWKNIRKKILSMGAKYNFQVELLMKSELKPILEIAGDIQVSSSTIKIENCSSPQFIVGLTQGILNAIADASEKEVEIKVEYEIAKTEVKLSLLIDED